ncbi:MAG: restriction endonuclease subunit S [Moraxellaceae bacterium]
MSAIQHLLTEHLDIWTAADTGPKSGRGRSAANAAKVYGISKLRELILELAVRGKLVHQDASDEPASELLKRIQAEMGRLVAEGAIRKGKPLPPITGVENLPALPQGWEWTSLGRVAQINPRNNAEDSFSASFVPMTMIGATFKSGHEQEIRPWKEIKQGFTHFAEGDVGVAKITPCFENSKACVFSGLVNGIGAGTTELHVVRPLAGTLAPRYVLAYLKSPQFLLIGESKMTGTAGQKRLPKEFVESNPFPLPPLSEQHRIVAKVDELMALCDQLEAEHSNASAAHEKLVSELLATLTQSPVRGAPVPQGDYLLGIEPRPSMASTSSPSGRTEFEENWQRIAAHFDTLFTTEASIDALKQALLQLAVMGKLVPQKPNDEPASELLKRIGNEKEKLIAEGTIRKEKPLKMITDEEKPFSLPRGWEWARLADIIKISSGDGLTSEQMDKSGRIPVYGGNGVNGYHSAANVNKPTLVIGRVGYYCGSIHITPEDAWVTDNAFITRFSENDIYLKYLYWLLRITNLKENEGATAQPVISGAKVYPIVIALPPLAEQHRIVAKVDELMALCDQLKSRLSEASQLQQKLADVLVENAVAAEAQPEHEEVDQGTARILLATEVVHQLKAEARMGQIKLQKVVNLAEYIACLKEIGSEPWRDVAGPYDRHFMEQVLQGMKSHQWYEEKTEEGEKAHRYIALTQAGQHRTDYEALWSPEQRQKISELIELMRPWKTDQCERVATLYSAWNDLLIEGREATEANILHEVLNRWNDSKRNYTEAQWQAELSAMKKHALLIPTGFGRRTTGGTLTLLPD